VCPGHKRGLVLEILIGETDVTITSAQTVRPIQNVIAGLGVVGAIACRQPAPSEVAIGTIGEGGLALFSAL